MVQKIGFYVPNFAIYGKERTYLTASMMSRMFEVGFANAESLSATI